MKYLSSKTHLLVVFKAIYFRYLHFKNPSIAKAIQGFLKSNYRKYLSPKISQIIMSYYLSRFPYLMAKWLDDLMVYLQYLIKSSKHQAVLLSLLLISSCFFACQEEVTSQEKSLEEIKSAGPISDIIRNPVSANQPIDTINVAKIEFEEEEFDFGETKEGGIIKHTFKFTNKGTVPLIITDARSTCGCTVPTWPKQPIAPGNSAAIDVRFDTKNKRKEQKKFITITANTYPATTKVLLKGFVKADES